MFFFCFVVFDFFFLLLFLFFCSFFSFSFFFLFLIFFFFSSFSFFSFSNKLEKMRVMEARKYQFYFWFRNLVIFISLVNYFLIPFQVAFFFFSHFFSFLLFPFFSFTKIIFGQFAFLSGNEEAHTFLFFYYLGMYLLNGANWYVVRLQVEDELHQVLSLFFILFPFLSLFSSSLFLSCLKFYPLIKFILCNESLEEK